MKKKKKINVDISLNKKEKRKIGQNILELIQKNFDISKAIPLKELKAKAFEEEMFGRRSIDKGIEQLQEDGKIAKRGETIEILKK